METVYANIKGADGVHESVEVITVGHHVALIQGDHTLFLSSSMAIVLRDSLNRYLNEGDHRG